MSLHNLIKSSTIITYVKIRIIALVVLWPNIATASSASGPSFNIPPAKQKFNYEMTGFKKSDEVILFEEEY